jgi:hypothetical protein
MHMLWKIDILFFKDHAAIAFQKKLIVDKKS